MLLAPLLQSLVSDKASDEVLFGAPLSVTGIQYHAGKVQPGDVFVALVGSQADGHDYVDQALARGAALAIVEKPVPQATGPILQVHDSRLALAQLAAAFYGHPSHDLTIIGITGTNGKTTTSLIIEKMMQAAGFEVGVMGTLNCRYAGKVYPAPLTTPEAPELHAMLHQMRSAGVTHMVMEISSHALAQKRVEGLAVDIGVFTNLTQDHLDFHGSMEAYRASKKRLFLDLLNTGPKAGRTCAVLNCHNAEGQALRAELSIPVVSTGFDPGHTVYATQDRYSAAGIQATLETPQGPLIVNSPLIGHHNLENILSAVGVGTVLKIPLTIMKDTLARLDQIPGRLQRIPDPTAPSGMERLLVVDYAHTPDALENALKSLQKLTRNRIICVFGCGGNRDRHKRPLMAAIAARLADLLILTADNPRNESPLQIIREMLAGWESANSAALIPALQPLLPEDVNGNWPSNSYLIEPDRRRAIRLAVAAAGDGDVVLVAGKGHETYQIVGAQVLDFDDVAEVSGALVDQAAGHSMQGVLDKAWFAEDVRSTVQGALVAGHPETRFRGVSTDTRHLAPHDLFVALSGERFDGHAFIPQALDRQAGGLLIAASALEQVKSQVSDTARTSQLPVITVKDTLQALGDLAAGQRRWAAARVIGLTGSNGKTSTRRMISLMLAQQYYVRATQGNFNNLIGLPLTLLEANPQHEWLVLEMGMNQPGEIGRLTDISQPDIGLITSIAAAHLEGLASLDGVMNAKGELLDHLPAHATAILNIDDAACRTLAGRFKGRVLYFGFAEGADVRAVNLALHQGHTHFELLLPGARVEVVLKTPARFMVANATAAAAAGYLAGLSPRQIKSGLEYFSPVAGRMQVMTLASGIHLINDTYNANPASMAAALDTLQQVRAQQRSIVVVGDMLELGPNAAEWHQQLGQQIAAAQIHLLGVTGAFAANVVQGARAAGLRPEQIITGTVDELLDTLKPVLQAGDWVLVKGSRGMRMERVVEGLKG